MGSFSFLVNYTCKIVFVSSIFAVSIIMYIYFLFLHISHSQTHAAGRQALKDAWFIWPINCHCQGREGEGEREKISLTLNAHLLRKKERKNELVKGTVPCPHLTLPIICQSYCEHHTGWPCLAHVFLLFFLLFFLAQGLFYSVETPPVMIWSQFDSRSLWSHLTFSNFHLSLKPQLFNNRA